MTRSLRLAAAATVLIPLASQAADQPVDWTRLLPPALTGTVALRQGSDGTRMVTLASAPLFAAYLAGYAKTHARADDADCRDALAADRGNRSRAAGAP